ncbi:MAG: YkgJ family cysteine cluster protein [Rhodospirillales bacterium]|nr:YkgJ family cysteine cluster protein [Rhodospirillales bacterium]
MSDIPGFECTSCGKCCLEGASQLQAVESDIEMWEKNAPHLLAYVTIHGKTGQRTADLWLSFSARKQTTRCKWIRKFPGREQYYCRIYQWRPQVCRRYPISLEHARFTDCPGAEVSDKGFQGTTGTTDV